MYLYIGLFYNGLIYIVFCYIMAYIYCISYFTYSILYYIYCIINWLIDWSIDQ